MMVVQVEQTRAKRMLSVLEYEYADCLGVDEDAAELGTADEMQAARNAFRSLSIEQLLVRRQTERKWNQKQLKELAILSTSIVERCSRTSFPV